MRIISRQTLAAFAKERPETSAALSHWVLVARKAEWKTMAEVLADFSKAKAINADRVRFEIAGGNFRLIAAINFRRAIVFVKFIGSHAEYDRVDALTVSQF